MNRTTRDLSGAPPPPDLIADYAPWGKWWPDTGRRIGPHEWALARVLTAGETVAGAAVTVWVANREHTLVAAVNEPTAKVKHFLTNATTAGRIRVRATVFRRWTVESVGRGTRIPSGEARNGAHGLRGANFCR